MRTRLLLVLMSATLAVMSIGPATAAPTRPAPAAGDAVASKSCDSVVDAGTPVLGSLLAGVTDVVPGVAGGALPIGLDGCDGVRPGGLVTSDAGMCSFNYVFAGSDGHTYIGTAGHCVLGNTLAEELWVPGAGPEARDATGQRVGEFAYAALGEGRDFAVVKVDPGVPVSPQMCHFGGPTGVNDDLGTGPVLLEHYGQGVALGQVIPGRTALALDMTDPDQVVANGLAVFGDSGSAINSADGRAVGVIVTVGLHLAGVPEAGVIGITRLSPQLQQAEDALGITLELQTAPQL